MKKFLVIFGTILVFFFSFATLFKLMHWPGSGPLFVVTMTLFAAIFIPVFFIERILSNKKGLNIAVNVTGMISCNMIFIGIMFKFMHWPGGSPMLVLGTLLFLFVTLTLFVVQQFKEFDRKFREFWRLVAGVILISVFLLFWVAQPTRNLVLDFLKVEDITLAANKNLEELNELYLNNMKEDSTYSFSSVAIADNIHNKSKQLVGYIENVKKTLIQHAELSDEANQNHWHMNSLSDNNISSYYLGEGSETGMQLLQNLNLYKQELTVELRKLELNEEEINKITDGIKTDVTDEMKMILFNRSDNWNALMFDNQIMAASLTLLTGIQNEILTAEFMSLSYIA